MPNEEKPRLTLVHSNSEPQTVAMEATLRGEEFKHLVATYTCTVAAKPRWCIWVDDDKGGKTVLYWIHPESDDELIARRIAKYLNQPNGLRDSASAEMTEWNPKLKRDPVYATHEGFDDEPPPLAA